MEQIKVPNKDGIDRYYPVVWKGAGVCVIDTLIGYNVTAINNGCRLLDGRGNVIGKRQSMLFAQFLDVDKCWQYLPVMKPDITTPINQIYGLPIIKEMCQKSLDRAAEQVKSVLKAGG